MTDARPTLFLHAGRHKTGTTSLQSFFARNEDAFLREYQLLYPRTGRIRNYHHGLFLEGSVYRETPPPELYATLRREISGSNAARVLLSSEVLSRSEVTTRSLKSVADELRDYGVKVIIYLRRQDDYAESQLSEAIKNGRCKFPQTIDDFDFMLDYEAFLERFAQAFGKQNLIIRSFEHGAESIYHDFVNAMGLAWSDSLERPQRRRNTHLPRAYLALLRVANRSPSLRRVVLNGRIQRLAERIHKRMPGLADLGHPISQRKRREIMAAAEASNRAVAQRFFGRDQLFS